MVAPYLGDCFVRTILSHPCRQAYVHCVKGAGALPGLGPAEPGQEPCDTTMHMDWMKSKEFKIPTKCVGTELLKKKVVVELN